jgi:MFS family permease
LASAILPFAPGYWPMLLLTVIAGLSSGTFYSLTMTFVLTMLPKRLIIFGIAAYAADIVFVSNIATLLEGWYIEHLSWVWIFWTAAAATPVMFICVYFGIPRKAPPGPRPSWRGFACFACPHLRRARSRRAPRLAQFRRDCSHACGRRSPRYCSLYSTASATESHSEPFVLEQ